MLFRSSGNMNVPGISTFSGISTHTTGLFGTTASFTGVVTATTAVVGSAVTVNASGITVTGVVTATSFVGSGANLTGLPAGYTELDGMLFG